MTRLPGWQKLILGLVSVGLGLGLLVWGGVRYCKNRGLPGFPDRKDFPTYERLVSRFGPPDRSVATTLGDLQTTSPDSQGYFVDVGRVEEGLREGHHGKIVDSTVSLQVHVWRSPCVCWEVGTLVAITEAGDGRVVYVSEEHVWL